jgi:hypothetical protein
MGVYLLYFGVVVGLLTVALRQARGRRRNVLLASAVTTLVLPVCITAVTIDANGAIWQGRYFLPFVVGILILCGTVIDDGHPAARGWLQVVAVLLLALAQGWSVSSVAADEARRSATHLGPDWVTLPPLALGVIVAVAWATLAGAAVRVQGPRQSSSRA